MSDIKDTTQVQSAGVKEKNPSLWKLVGWEAEVLWGGGIGFLVAGWSPPSSTDINIYQLDTILSIHYNLFGIAALLLGSAFAICNVLIKTRIK